MFNKIITMSDWSYLDQLNGKTLKDGELILVKWPNGVEEEHTVFTKRYEQQYQDHTSPCTIPYVEAYIKIAYNGSLATVRAVGLEAKRI